MNSDGVSRDDPCRYRTAAAVFSGARVHPRAWLDEDGVAIRLLADMIRRVATDGRETRRGGGRRDPTRSEVEAVFDDIMVKYHVPADEH